MAVGNPARIIKELTPLQQATKDLEKYYRLNGAIYIYVKLINFLKIKAFF